MNNKFDELTKGLTESVTQRQVPRQFGADPAGTALFCLALASAVEPSKTRLPGCAALQAQGMPQWIVCAGLPRTRPSLVSHVVTRVALVALGGAIGSIARYGVGALAAQLLGSAFPFGTLVVNLTGSFLISIIMHAALAGTARRARGGFPRPPGYRRLCEDPIAYP